MKPEKSAWRCVVVGVLCFAVASPAGAWDAVGHRLITLLALDGLPADMPAFLKEEAIRKEVAWQASAPDRWRAVNAPTMGHQNNPDHFLDIDDLPNFGLTLQTISPFRYEYARDLMIAKHTHPEQAVRGGGEPYNPKRDPTRSSEFPGYLPHAIIEHYNKLSGEFKTYRILIALNDPKRAHQLEMEKKAIQTTMGTLSHYVGDAAQPLHTTKHHHGWVGDNPNGYTTERGIHAYIDGTVIKIHKMSFETVRPDCTFDKKVDAQNPWEDVLAHIERSFAQVEPLYVLKKNGDLEKDTGKKFITERLADAGAMLSALYAAAWKAGEPTEKDIQDYVRYDGTDNP